MDIIQVIVYGVLIIAFLALMGLAGYLAYDYLEYKKRLQNNLIYANKGINLNFDISSSNLERLDKSIDENRLSINENRRTTSLVDSNVRNTSNVISNRITNTSNIFNQVFNSFDDNLNKYFEFKDGGNHIKNTSGFNNKIFNYIFGASTVQNLELIAKTTAHSGLTIMSDVNEELIVCNSNLTNKCIKMMTDIDGNFNILPAGTNNITFKNNTNDVIFAQFDTQNKNIYLGGSNVNTAPLYVKDNNVYVKNMRMITASDDTKNRLYNYEDILNAPLYTKCELTNSKTTPSSTTTTPAPSSTTTTPAPPAPGTEGFTSDVYNTTIDIKVKFNTNYYIGNYKKLYIDIAQYVNINKLDPIQFSSSKTGDTITASANVVFIKSFQDPSVSSSTDLREKIYNYNKATDGHMTFKFYDTLTEIPAGTELNIIFQIYQNTENITTLPDSITNFKFITNSYLINAT